MNDPPTEVNPKLQKIADRYILEEIIGEGSYSIVFRGYDTEYHRKVAIKELKSQGLTKEETNEAQQLFFNEINVLKQLSHANIPAVFDFFLFEDRHYMVMQWVEGRNLLSLIEKGETLSQGEALYYMRQITDALVYLQKNERRIVYKDLKPSNIIVNDEGHVWIIDFGTARFYSPEKKKDTHILGTPGYAPPEAYTGAQTDLSADIYSLGATFYHLVTGQEPFRFKFNFPSPCKFKPELTQKFSSLLLACLKPRDMRIPHAADLKRHIDNLDPEFFHKDDEREETEDNDKTSKGFVIPGGSKIFLPTILFSFLYVNGTYDFQCFSCLIFIIALLCFPLYFLNSKSPNDDQDRVILPIQIILTTLLFFLFNRQDPTTVLFSTALPIMALYTGVNFLFTKYNIKLHVYIQLLAAMEIYMLVHIFIYKNAVLDLLLQIW